MDTIKCVLVGDTDIGKTHLLTTYITKIFPKEYMPGVFNINSTTISVDSHTMNLELRDTCGMTDYDSVRHLGYNGVDVFIICFSIANPTSFDNVKNKWLPEVKHHDPKLPILLVGTQTDLRTDPQVLEKLKKQNQIPITQKQGKVMAKQIQAAKYLECAAITQEGLNEVFVEVVHIYFRNLTKQTCVVC